MRIRHLAEWTETKIGTLEILSIFIALKEMVLVVKERERA
jgi:hypothetical protein